MTRSEVADRGGRVVAIELPWDEQSPGAARREVAAVLSGWPVGDPDLVDSALLVVSELVTNAVIHGHTSLRLELVLEPEAVTVTVSDGSARLPMPRISGTEEENGRGLALLDALCSEWGYQLLPHGGKCVWCRLEAGVRGTG